MLGKISWYLKAPAEAAMWLRRAAQTLTLTHGPKHALVERLRNLLGEATAEAAHLGLQIPEL